MIMRESAYSPYLNAYLHTDSSPDEISNATLSLERERGGGKEREKEREILLSDYRAVGADRVQYSAREKYFNILNIPSLLTDREEIRVLPVKRC